MDWKQIIEDAGGYVHPDLILQVGAEAKHGKLSLAGVPSDVLSIRIPKSLGETTAGRWIDYMIGLNYVIDVEFNKSHSFTEGYFPLLGAANHNSNGGTLKEDGDFYELYGIDFQYSGDKAHLKRQWGIDE